MPSRDLQSRIRAALGRLDDVSEKGIVGGPGFLWRGHLLCGVVSGDLVVRVGSGGFADAVAEPGAAPMTMGGRASRAWVHLDAAHLRTDRALQAWLDRAIEFVATLPAKPH